MATQTPELTTGGAEVADVTGYSVREGAVALLNSLALGGPIQFHHRSSGDLRGLKTPVGMVSKARGAFNVNPQAPCGQVDNRFSFYIVIVRSDQKPLDASSPYAKQSEEWLEQAARIFNGTRPGLSLPHGCVISSTVVDNDPRFTPAFVKQLDAVYLLVNVVVREASYRA